ncbi:MAG: hypothetical protein Q7S58_06010 [Candidatus Binatus sp.]|uniref:hypothetical protein n=1 Tax=Candidatus Binatus sp. TaxID=2811406 RepID=UPI0027286073|nr:hypothetical protein [Candidatus Binatus sp.]MDO8431951.1 hypothetical protein [Candidatus Binatus sp.]
METAERERLIALVEKVLRLRGELREAERELDRSMPLIRETTVQERNGQAQQAQVAQTGSGNLVEQVIGLLNRNPHRAFSAGDVVKELHLPYERMHTVRSTLWGIAKKGRIVNSARGKFCAANSQHVESEEA